MAYVAALSFHSYEDFEVCNKYIDVKPGDTASSSDGMFTAMVKTERQIPPGILVVEAEDGKKVFVRVISGTEGVVGTYKYTEDAEGSGGSLECKVPARH